MTIVERQDEPHSIELNAAQRQLYSEAKRAWAWRLIGSLGVAAVAPFFALLWAASGTVLTAIAAVWLLIARVVLRPRENRNTARAAAIQEQFDTYVLRLPWSAAEAEPAEAMEMAAAARRHFARDAEARRNDLTGWYADPRSTLPPYDTLMCQRANLNWSSKLHAEWTTVHFAALALWVLLGIAAAALRGLSIPELLLAIVAPSAPAFVDAVDTWNDHREHGERKAAAENQARKLWSDGMSRRRTVTVDDCRALQDHILRLRRVAVWVPDWYYNLRKSVYEQDMQAATAALVEEARQQGFGEQPSAS